MHQAFKGQYNGSFMSQQGWDISGRRSRKTKKYIMYELYIGCLTVIKKINNLHTSYIYNFVRKERETIR